MVIMLGTIFLIRGINKPSSPVASLKTTKLADYADKDSATVNWTMKGRIVGDDKYKELHISVSKNQRSAEITNGYNHYPGKSVNFPNTAEAFKTFMLALDNLNFGRPRSFKTSDERGFCPFGNRMVYELTDGSKQVFRTWSDTCQSGDGTFGGTQTTTALLFKTQITDYDKFINNLSF